MDAVVKIIHFSFGFMDATMPAHIQKHITDTAHENPDFEVKVWGPKESRELLVLRHPDLVALYDAFPYPIQRSDMSRYVILERWGGVYTDLDYRFKVPMRTILRTVAHTFPGCEVFVNESPNKVITKRASNSFMGAMKAGHGFWKTVLEVIRNHARDTETRWALHRTPNDTVMSSTGPRVVDKALRLWSSRHPAHAGAVVMLPAEQYNPCSICEMSPQKVIARPSVLAYHLNAGSWHKGDSLVVNYLYCQWYWFIITLVLLVALVAISAVVLTNKHPAVRRI
jgi:mannosyltransferase OCH1-like enzyme